MEPAASKSTEPEGPSSSAVESPSEKLILQSSLQAKLSNATTEEHSPMKLPLSVTASDSQDADAPAPASFLPTEVGNGTVPEAYADAVEVDDVLHSILGDVPAGAIGGEESGLDDDEEEEGEETEDDETERIARVFGADVFEPAVVSDTATSVAHTSTATASVGSGYKRKLSDQGGADKTAKKHRQQQQRQQQQEGEDKQQQQEDEEDGEANRLLALMAHFPEDHLNRFESYKRATFTKSVVSRLIQSVSQTPFSQNVVIAMAGITKVFVGELVEEALRYKEQLNESGPLLPRHIRVAYSRLQAKQRTSRPNRSSLLI